MDKRLLILLFTLQISFLCYSQAQIQSREIRRITGRCYLLEKGRKYEIDENFVLARLKNGGTKVRGNVKVMRYHPYGMLEISVPKNVPIEEFVKSLEKSGDYEYIEYDTFLMPCMSVNDSYYNQQWGLNSIHVQDAWEMTSGLPSVKVAVIDDEGFEYNHPDLNYGIDSFSNINVSEGVNYVSPNDSTPEGSHGTMIAGIICAKTNNTIGISGIAGGNNSGGVKVIPYRSKKKSQAISAIYNAISKGVKVINLSFSCDESSEFNQAINSAYDNGITIVCSAGNDPYSQIVYPASHELTIAVGSIDAYNMAYYSNHGNELNLVAPGVNILSTSTIDDLYYDNGSGSSYAAPHVSGVACLMLSVNPSLTPYQIKNILENTAQKVNPNLYINNALGWNEYTGHGLVNAAAAVLEAFNPAISGPDVLCCSATATYSVTNLPSCATITWSTPGFFLPVQTSGNSCIVTNTNNYNTTFTIKADIKINGNIIKTLEKNIKIHGSFFGYYISGNYSGNISLDTPFFVSPGEMTYIESANFRNKNVTYASGFTNPSIWEYDGNEVISLIYPSYSNGPLVINVTALPGEPDCDDFQLTIFPANTNNSVSVIQGNGYINISLAQNAHLKKYAKEYIGDREKPTQEWSIYINNVITGRKMISTIITDDNCTIDTSNWPLGVYLLYVAKGDNVFSKKILIQ